MVSLGFVGAAATYIQAPDCLQWRGCRSFQAAEQESPIHKVHDPLLDADDDPHASDPYDRFHEEEEEEDLFAVPAPVRRGGVRLPPLATDARPLRSALG